ncbi:hypothetical protein [Flavobacterium sp.]|uniref:hypothetical protein n=1 Tax=Flavobacterium sp. TaxID=239 RepID=UPI0025FE0341|nr:hypothetical protein [Flavobacterium sp.]
MKIFFTLIFLIFVQLFGSCKKQPADKPKVTYDASSKTKPEVAVNKNQIEIADLPINMVGTNFLLHPIGVVSGSGKGIKSSNNSEDGFTVSNYGEFQITGYLKNIKFQEIGKDSIYALTNKVVLIETATYLKAFADKSKKQVLVYSLVDKDTNNDGKLDNNDIKSLYISTISGQEFAKLTPDFQELIDWKIIESKGILYFRTIEDTNKNGEFDKKDKVYYYCLNLLNKEWKTSSYNPIN